MVPSFWPATRYASPTTTLQSNDFDCGIFICLYAAFLDIRLPLSFSQHDTPNVRTAWMAHEMIEEGKLLKMSHSVLHDSPLATAIGNSETKSDNSMVSKRSSKSQLQGDIKRQKTNEPEASEEKKNLQAAAEFWAVMQHTHGFQNQDAGPQVQATAANVVAHSTAPGTSSRQQVEAFLESQGNPKRRRGSDDKYKNPTNHSLGTITAKPDKRNKEFTGEFTKPNTTTTSHSDTPVSGSGDAASLTTNEAEKSVLTNGGSHWECTEPTIAAATLKDASTLTSPPDSKECIQVELRRQMGDIDTSAENAFTSTFHVQTPTTTNYGVLVGRETIALTPIEGHFTATPQTTVERRERKKQKTGHTHRTQKEKVRERESTRACARENIHNTHVILHSFSYQNVERPP